MTFIAQSSLEVLLYQPLQCPTYQPAITPGKTVFLAIRWLHKMKRTRDLWCSCFNFVGTLLYVGEVGQKDCKTCFCLKSGIIFRKQTLGPDVAVEDEGGKPQELVTVCRLVFPAARRQGFSLP